VKTRVRGGAEAEVGVVAVVQGLVEEVSRLEEAHDGYKAEEGVEERGAVAGRGVALLPGEDVDEAVYRISA
jgi:hypothetical protein